MNRVKGFTLAEMLITMLILSILIVMALPGFSSLLFRAEAHALQRKLMVSISYSRTLAVSMQTSVTLCSGTTSCEKEWGDHLLIFSDHNQNGLIDGEDEISKQVVLGKEGSSLRWKSFRRKPYLVFTALGQAPSSNGTFHYCPENDRKSHRFSFVLAKTGRARAGSTVNCD